MKMSSFVNNIIALSKKWVNSIKETDYLIVTSVVSILICYFLNPFINVNMTAWDRSFSQAALNGISIGKRVFNIYFYNYILIPTIALCVSIIVCFVLNRGDEVLKRSVRNICLILTPVIVVVYLSKFSEGSVTEQNIDVIILTSLFFIIALFVSVLFGLTDRFEYDDFIQIYVNHLFFTLVISLPLNMTEIKYVLLMTIIFTLTDCLVMKYAVLNEVKNVYIAICSCLYYSIAVWVIITEGMYIIVSRGMSINHPARVLLFAMISFSAICVIAVIVKRGKLLYERHYFGVVLSVLLLTLINNQYQLYYDLRNYANLFEVENRAIVLETFTRGKMPIIDYFPAHAMLDVLSAIFYWICGGDVRTAIFSNPWGEMYAILSLITFYLVLKQLFDKNWTIMLFLLFPFAIQNVFWAEMAFVSVLGLLAIINHPKQIAYYYIFWFALLIGAFSRYDSGISMAIGCFFALIVLVCIRKASLYRCLVSAFTTMILVAFGTWFYCARTGIDFFSRIREWIYVGAKSSGTWATVAIGDPKTFKFFVAYELMPLLASLILLSTVFLLFKSKTAHKSGLLSLIFSVAYAFMITRILVFHNLATTKTGWTGVVLNYFHLSLFFFVLFICDIRRTNSRQRIGAPLLTLMITLCISIIGVGDSVPNNTNTLFGKAYAKAQSFDFRKTGITGGMAGVERTVFSDWTVQLMEPFKRVFDLLLTDEQTFIDFANVTGLYALTERECPSYVPQSPSLLSNEPSHEYFLREIQSADAPLAIIGKTDSGYLISMQGIRHNVRYYKIAEYIYSNYKPLVQIGTDFTLWCQSEFHEDYVNKLKESGYLGEQLSLINIGYDPDLHAYSVQGIPYYWANMDTRKAIENDVICEALFEERDIAGNTRYGFVLPETSDKSDGQYICFVCNSQGENDEIASFTMLAGEEQLYSFSFSVFPGSNTYIMRVSIDPYWFFANINAVEFHSDNSNISFDDVRILAGD